MDVRAVLRRIDEQLRVLGISQERASKLAGHPDCIRNMRRGKGANIRTLAALARILEVTPTWLIGEEAEPSAPAAPAGDLDTLRRERIRLLRQLESVDYAISVLEQVHTNTPPKRRRKIR